MRRVFYEADETDDLQAQYRSAAAIASAYAWHLYHLHWLAAAWLSAWGAPGHVIQTRAFMCLRWSIGLQELVGPA